MSITDSIVVCRDYAEMSRKAAEVFADYIKKNPHGILGLATGSSPEGLYDCLVEKYEKGELDFSGITSYNLDEYYPITPDNDHSYRYFMDRHLFDRVNINKANTYVPDGTAADPDAFCREYDAEIKAAGGIGIQLLGVGQNGHIGFNEPATPFYSFTHIQKLTDRTKRSKAERFGGIDNVPAYGITMGLKTITEARNIILLAYGEEKSAAVYQMVYGKTMTYLPASFLQIPLEVTVYLDTAAASKL